MLNGFFWGFFSYIFYVFVYKEYLFFSVDGVWKGQPFLFNSISYKDVENCWSYLSLRIIVVKEAHSAILSPSRSIFIR